MITLGLVDSVDDNGVYVTMPESKGVLRGPYKALSTVAAGTTVLVASTDDGEQVVVGTSPGGDGSYNVKWLGAVGDGATDDTAAIQATIDAAATTGGVVYFPPVDDSPTVGYKTTATLEVPYNVDVIMDAAVRYAGAGGEPAISINGTGSDGCSYRRYRLQVVRATLADWEDEADIGVVLRNVVRSRIEIGNAHNFTIGAQLKGDAAGFFYNHVELGTLAANKVALDLVSDDAGWVNENLFLGGCFVCWSDTHLSKTRYGVRIRSLDGYYQNANVFHKPSFEVGRDLTGGAESIPVLITHGLYNAFYDARNEGQATDPTMRLANDSTCNIFTSTYTDVLPWSSTSLDDAGTAPASRTGGLRALPFLAQRTLFAIPAIHKAAVPYDSDEVNVPGMFAGDSSSATQLIATDDLTITDTYLEVGNRTLGVLVDVRQVKRFVIDCGAEAGYRGRLVVRCYDSSDNILDPADYTATPLIRGATPTAFSETTDYGGAYRHPADADDGDPWYVAVCHEDVAYIAVMATKGTTDLRMTCFAVRTDEVAGHAAVWTPFPQNAQLPMATQAPASGTWDQGMQVWNASAASGQPMGWVCVTAGTPGTWKAMANLA